jgi:hypothetical protein
MKRIALLAAWVPALAAVPARAQSFNVDFGAGSAPASSYAAVGAPGAWNVVGVLPPGERAPLVDLLGEASAARIYMIGGTALLDSDDPLTGGDDASLLDDMLIGFNDPVDVCVWIEGLANGDYGVVLYALTPNDPLRDCRTRVDFAPEGPVDVGGAWPGSHQETVSYAHFTVSVTDGTIGLHSGLFGGNFQSGLNGIQVLDLSTTSARATLAPRPPLRAYPNPARGAQVIEGSEPRAGGVDVEIVDVAGRVVWRHAFPAPAGPWRSLWDGTDRHGRRVPGAVYFARVRGAGGETGAVKLVRWD